ncbi:MAG TPA: TetR/AcrR family transcriptional regulator [Polyangiaceae bacterium]|jgi:AcrR family transcriptional regulator|nr:TetR/AcrR family transcriptional regulator [Polyangiaceae bacterium]
MARPQSITDDEILAAARAIFLNKGISGTVEEVAERCRVGVATIFRRFPTKQALFIAAMEAVNESEWNRYITSRSRGAGNDARAGLVDLAKTMLDAARKMVPLIMMKASNPAVGWDERRAKRAMAIVHQLTEFFEAETAAHRVVDVDPRVLSRVWLGAIRHIVMFEMIGGPSIDDLSTNEFIEGLADLFCPPPSRTRKR